jgi:hypothetical protein
MEAEEMMNKSRSQESEFRIQKRRKSVNATLRRLFWILASALHSLFLVSSLNQSKSA